jgi:hypothetical protein
MQRSFKIVLALALTTGPQLLAEVQLAPVFSDNMVLQREVAMQLRGMADDEKQVSVSFNDNE